MKETNKMEPMGPELRFRTYLNNGQFQIQRCGACGSSIFYPRAICPHCGNGDQLEWYAPSGLGTVYSTTVVRRKPELGPDYNVALIDLQEGPRMMSRVQGISPDDVRIGMQVTAQIINENDKNLIVFSPVGVHKDE